MAIVLCILNTSQILPCAYVLKTFAPMEILGDKEGGDDARE